MCVCVCLCVFMCVCVYSIKYIRFLFNLINKENGMCSVKLLCVCVCVCVCVQLNILDFYLT